MTTNQPGVTEETLASISTPDHVESRLGPLEFVDGAPSEATADLLYEHLDFISGVKAFIDAYPGASLVAIRRGFRSIGVEDNSILLFSELMDSASLFLTANTDTIYALGFVDLSDGPMVVDVPSIPAPSGFLGTVDDMWFRWITDMGLPGRSRNRRTVPARRAGLRRAAARGRVLRVALQDHAGDPAAASIHDRQRPPGGTRRHPQRSPHLSVHAGRARDLGGLVPRW